MLIAAAALSGAAQAAPIPWKSPTYTLVARDMDLRAALDTFAVAEGLSVVMSQAVFGRFSGDFRDVPASEFLERLATVHNLTWYYDGAALYVYGAGEIQTMLIDLQYMKAGELRVLLSDLGVEDERFPLKTASNDELIMVSGPPRYVGIVAETIAKADKLREMRTFNEVEVRLFPLVNTWADDVSFNVTSPESTMTIKGVARLLEDMMNAEIGQKSIDASSSTNSASLRDSAEVAMNSAFRPTIRPENRINAVVVRDVKSRMPMYEQIIRQLDVPQKLVEISVTTVELTRRDALDWQLSLAYGGSRGHSVGAAGQNAANIFAPADLAGQGLAGAITHIHSSWSIAASLTALRDKGKARNISRTTLLTVNNLAAYLSDTQSYHARVVGTEVASLEEVTAGTMLNIKPRVIPSVSTNLPGRVWLTLQLDDGGFEAVTVDAMPMKRTSSIQTQTAVFEDESIMLAGYLRDIEESGGWGIPYLRDIPWIGWLFGGASTHKETVQRMFILTPRVVDLDEETLARLQSTRLRDITLEESLEDDAKESDNAREIRELKREELDERRNRRLEELVKELRELQKARKEAMAQEAAKEAKEKAAEEAAVESESTPGAVAEKDTGATPEAGSEAETEATEE